MKKLHKALLSAIAILGLLFSICTLSLFYPIPLVSDMVNSYRGFLPLPDIFAGYNIFICLCFFLLLLAALFSPDKSNELIIAKGKGTLIFSKQAVESIVSYSFADITDIKLSRVRVKIGKQPEKTRIYVKLSLNDTGKLLNLTETVQGKIEASLKASLGINVNSIIIRVAELSSGGKAESENNEDTQKESRVV